MRRREKLRVSRPTISQPLTARPRSRDQAEARAEAKLVGGRSGIAEPGMKFLADGGAGAAAKAFKHRYAVAKLAWIGRRVRAFMSCAEDADVDCNTPTLNPMATANAAARNRAEFGRALPRLSAHRRTLARP